MFGGNGTSYILSSLQKNVSVVDTLDISNGICDLTLHPPANTDLGQQRSRLLKIIKNCIKMNSFILIYTNFQIKYCLARATSSLVSQQFRLYAANVHTKTYTTDLRLLLAIVID
jgi:hypothetical protein